ncbi:MAG: hypothetical protein A2015_06580 [Spirochaetes bacterium GWF1_31_7]|nr:MAG: hypothetical protein A2Y30_08415 [Spirochaetes bacterium GWE1_32_154]OHD51411.1 MAG: hypothetical protein A2Y29_14800 [Spirochaetes bacterium GWE2_31_10]OHD53137.1 MAG: hypothetical protein A2015_06580 [Spirochaetes bacterium GWF1_31_7]HBD94442.1 hypothetical protein [Spirochaetia bacterium]HBI36087.1 hypothetical protein [Spirochaetia bacterium]
MQNFVVYMSVFFAGVTVTCSLFMFLFGQKSIGTRFHALFFSYLALFLICLILEYTGVRYMSDVIGRMQYYIPIFFMLFVAVQHTNKFSMKYLLFFLIPIPVVYLNPHILFSILYHAVSWTILSFATIRLFGSAKQIPDEKKKKFNFLVALLIGLSIVPFIIINVVTLFIYKMENPSLIMFPPVIALTALLDFYFSYKINFLSLDHSYYADIDFIQKSMAFEKKTLIEKLSAGLIHEIKNPVTAIQSINQQLLSRIDSMDKESIIRYLSVIASETDRIKDLAETYLKNFRSGKKGSGEIINLKEIAGSLITLIKPELTKKNGVICIDKSCENTFFYCNNSEFRQILINLIYNALEADAKSITISAQSFVQTVEIFITDDGKGVDPTVKTEIFRPFYTTKMEGTGLGLSISKEILNCYFGQLELYQSSDSGTIFKITLPIGDSSETDNS